MTRTIIIGASSGIGLELTRQYLELGHIVGATARGTKPFPAFKAKYPDRFYYLSSDISKSDSAENDYKNLLQQTGGTDLVIICAGISVANPTLQKEAELQTVATNVSGFTRCSLWFIGYFKKQGYGHLAALSSLAHFYGSGERPAYNASKSFISKYLQGMAVKFYKSDITVSDIRPGLVDTPMVEGLADKRLMIPVDRAAKSIIRGLEKKRRLITVGKGWWLLARLAAALPFPLFRRFYYSASPSKS